MEQNDEKKTGGSVEIFYNPENLSESYYSRIGLTGGMIILLFAQIFLIMGIDQIKNLN